MHWQGGTDNFINSINDLHLMCRELNRPYLPHNVQNQLKTRACEAHRKNYLIWKENYLQITCWVIFNRRVLMRIHSNQERRKIKKNNVERSPFHRKKSFRAYEYTCYRSFKCFSWNDSAKEFEENFPSNYTCSVTHKILHSSDCNLTLFWSTPIIQ